MVKFASSYIIILLVLLLESFLPVSLAQSWLSCFPPGVNCRFDNECCTKKCGKRSKCKKAESAVPVKPPVNAIPAQKTNPPPASSCKSIKKACITNNQCCSRRCLNKTCRALSWGLQQYYNYRRGLVLKICLQQMPFLEI
jgi:hypothetical protein